MRKKWSYQINGNYEGNLETNRRRLQKLWLLHCVSEHSYENRHPYETYLPPSHFSEMILYEKLVSKILQNAL